jgi:hypothetical protein
MRRITPILALAAALALAGAGCSDDKNPLSPTTLAPEPTTPTNVVRLVEWCWNNRNVDTYSGVFTDDYVFAFAYGDSAGNAYRATPWTRTDEVQAAAALFVGSPTRDPAGNLRVSFDPVLVSFADDRPGKDPKWHRYVRTSVNLLATFHTGLGPEVDEVRGYAKFYVVRGDSALIPPELVALGFTADSTRWWVERWKDETLPGTGGPPTPQQVRSWGGLKALFR